MLATFIVDGVPHEPREVKRVPAVHEQIILDDGAHLVVGVELLDSTAIVRCKRLQDMSRSVWTEGV